MKYKTSVLMNSQIITINPSICHGKPTIRGTRYMVESILEYLAGGSTISEILEEFPDLNKEDVQECLKLKIWFQ